MIRQLEFEPQLLSSIDGRQLELYMKSIEWFMVEKFDGERLLVSTDGHAYNRSGIETGLPDMLRERCEQLPQGWLFDGEWMGDEYIVFDVLRTPSEGDITKLSWLKRQDILFSAIDLSGEFVYNIINPDTMPWPVSSEDSKRLALQEVIDSGGEGVVFYKASAPYRFGRSASAKKFKFVFDADFVVTDVSEDGRDNLTLGLYDGNELVPVGKVSKLSGSGSLACVGDVVTVSFVKVTKSGKLFQPTKPRVRYDKPASQCGIAQLDHVRKDH